MQAVHGRISIPARGIISVLIPSSLMALRAWAAMVPVENRYSVYLANGRFFGVVAIF
jgi:hypothetical protein